MSTLYMKITGYDQPSNSLLVSFASSDTQSQNPADYPSVAIQVSAWNDVDSVKRELAKVGIQVAKAQANKEQVQNNASNVEQLTALVGQEFSFAEADLNVGSYNNEVTL